MKEKITMKIITLYRRLRRIKINQINQSKLTNHNFTIISSNCVGGVIYYELNEKFNSPTINLYMTADDYIKFLENIDFYLDKTIKEVKSDKFYPVGRLGDIILNFVHYSTFEEAVEKWEERKKRINFNNIFIIMVQRDGCDENIIKRFNDLPYHNKIIFTTSKYTKYSSACYIKGSELTNEEVTDLCLYDNKLSPMRYIDRFDYVKWINNGK